MVQIAYRFILFLVLVDLALSSIQNGTEKSPGENLLKTRRKGASRSTSSSSGDRQSTDDSEGESLMISDSSSSSSSQKDRSYRPKSSEERKGWRKWHRKCTPCPEDMKKKWRDPTLKWICGAYQRARRSFKSECMMYYRNCQDGTMFVKIHDHRCQNGTKENRRGDHFFYDYRVKLVDDDSSSRSSDSTSSMESSISV